MASSRSLLLLTVTALLAMVVSQALASDPDPLQDFCVVDEQSHVLVNGFVCKNLDDVKPEDFFASGFDKPGNTAEKLGSAVTPATVTEIPGLNTLGVSLVRLDFAPKGLIAPHYHPRATEILTVVDGTLYVGFVTSNPNKLFAKVLSKGDVFVFPKALIHFQFNPSHDMPAVAISGLSSQNPGVVTVADAVFGANPQISDEVLAKVFQLDKKTVDWLQAQFSMNN